MIKKNKQIKIIFADDQVLMRNALGGQLNSLDEFDVIGLASDGNEVINLLKIGTIPDILLLDLAMPGLGGFETTQFVCANFPTVKVVILTMFDSEISFIRLLRAGAKAFLKKDIEQQELRRALNFVANGGYFYGFKEMGRFTEILRNSNEDSDLLRKKMLSELEIRFLQLAASDLTYKAIAEILQMSPRKIDHLRDNLFAKLDVKSRVGLSMFAVRNGLVDF